MNMKYSADVREGIHTHTHTALMMKDSIALCRGVKTAGAQLLMRH